MATESIGVLVPTAIPGYEDAADIQAALRAYHYGSYSYDPANTSSASLVNPSIAYTLTDLQTQITAVNTGIQSSIFTAKGGLITATASNTPIQLAVGASDGMVLTVNSGTATGLEWATPLVTPTNSVTLTNKTLTSPIISTISNTGTLTLPTSTDTLVGRATTDTLTNKTLTSPIINIAINAQTGTTYTPVLSDNGKLITCSNASAITFTIPPNSSVAYATGAQINIIQKGVGKVTFAQGSGVTIRSTGVTSSSPELRTQYSAATAIYEGSDVWYIVGDIS